MLNETRGIALDHLARDNPETSELLYFVPIYRQKNKKSDTCLQIYKIVFERR